MAGPGGSEFDLARKRAAQSETAQLQTQRDALARRAAQTGPGVQGAMIKQEQVVTDQSAQRLAQANEGIDTGERIENRRVREVHEGRDFQRGERLGSQEFASGESAMQRRFMTGERLGSQDFSAGQASDQRGFLTSERLGSQGFMTGERMGSQDFADEQRQAGQRFTNKITLSNQRHQNKLNDKQMAQQAAQFEANLGFQGQQFEWEKYIDEKNLDLAARIQRANEKPGMIEGLFGGFGGMGGGMGGGGVGVGQFR